MIDASAPLRCPAAHAAYRRHRRRQALRRAALVGRDVMAVVGAVAVIMLVAGLVL
ncbi:hypothetical protein ACSBOB_14710 [Mesorhizobium sp. ASY16-5R]|uniref:hypothetical protein n=1 Tax=Mesorhizobium sp. ASY16-5R TaxID=3445772 RepID=UPI003F9EFA40